MSKDFVLETSRNNKIRVTTFEQDLTVPITDGENLYSWADNEMTEFVKIPTAGHTFNARHPFERSNSKLELVLEKTGNFLKII